MRWIRRHLLAVIAIAVLAYLFIPILIVAVLSFNQPSGRFNTSWNAFSLEAWQNLCAVPGVCQSSSVGKGPPPTRVQYALVMPRM